MKKVQSVASLSLALLAGLFSGCSTESPSAAQPGTVAASGQPPAGFRLTVELRDGSRVVGTSEDNKYAFKSELLGPLRLPLQKVRRVESTGSPVNTNLVKLTTAEGDTLAVKFVTPVIRLATAHGELRLPVDQIKSLRVSASAQIKIGRPKDGLIGLWSGEGNADDSVGGNNGVLRNVAFTQGVVGKSFSFAPNNFRDGTYTGVMIPDRPAYALTNSLTIDAWVRPRGDGACIVFRGDNRPGLDPYTLSVHDRVSLTFQICGANGESVHIETTLRYCVWTHVAAVLDGDAGTMTLYTNGTLAVQATTGVRPMGELIPTASPGFGIGNVNDGGNNFPFAGDIDEVALYNRALSADEVDAIYEENFAHAGGSVAPLPPRNANPPAMSPNRFTLYP